MILACRAAEPRAVRRLFVAGMSGTPLQVQRQTARTPIKHHPYKSTSNLRFDSLYV